jgi:hypothetical protein
MEWSREDSQIAINRFNNTGRVLAGMERLDEHHIVWTRKQIQALGGAAVWTRNLKPLRPRVIQSSHKALHANVNPSNLLPQEHARYVFRGVEELGLQYMPTMQAVDALASHMGKVSLRSSTSVQAQRVAQGIEQCLIEQRPYLVDGMVV